MEQSGTAHPYSRMGFLGTAVRTRLFERGTGGCGLTRSEISGVQAARLLGIEVVITSKLSSFISYEPGTLVDGARDMGCASCRSRKDRCNEPRLG
jgi:hypothetical protein